MREFLLASALAAIGCVSALAAEYAPIIEEGKTWEYVGFYEREVDGKTEGGSVRHFMKFNGAVTVNGKEYHLLQLFKSVYTPSENGSALEPEEKDRTDLQYFMREDEGKLYTLTLNGLPVITKSDVGLDPNIAPTEYNEALQYDFSASTGQEIEILAQGEPAVEPVIVKVRPSVSINGSERKVMTYLWKHGDDEILINPDQEMIEGIGVTADGCLPHVVLNRITGWVNNRFMPAQGSVLDRVSDADGNVLYQQPEFHYSDNMAVSGNIWVYSGHYERTVNGKIENGTVYHYMKFDGDAMVNHDWYDSFVLFKSEYVRYNGESGAMEHSETMERTGPRYFLRAANGRVYVLTLDDQIFVSQTSVKDSFDPTVAPERYGEFLRYDFTLVDGDMFFLPCGGNMGEIFQTTVQIDEPVQVNGKDRKTLSFIAEPGSMGIYPGQVIDGIGATKDGDMVIFGPPYSTGMPNNSYAACDGSILKCVYSSWDDCPIYGSMPTVGVSLTEADPSESGIIYDMMGRRVERVLPGSVYVRDGKKFVGK